jgi:Ca2+-binding EF-hand superfamily protein
MTGWTFTAMASAPTSSTEGDFPRMFLLFLAAAAAAKPHATAPDTSTRAGLIASYENLLKRVDTDGDGKISRAEWGAMVDASPILQSLSLSQAQREAMRTSLMAGFDRDDSDKDGMLTLDEMLAKPLFRFACVDANHDGKATQAEIAANMERCSAQ